MAKVISRRLVTIGLVATVLGALAGYLLSPQRDRTPPSVAIPGLLWPNPKPLAPFELLDHTGAAFNLQRLAGKWTFLFFGYTHCPDICPSTMATLARVASHLAPEVRRGTQFVFVSVDPARDTRRHLAEYVRYFDPAFVGVSAELNALDALTRQLGIVHIRGNPDPQGEYVVDHSAAVLLIDPEGRMLGVFSAPHDASDIGDRFQRIRTFVGGRNHG